MIELLDAAVAARPDAVAVASPRGELTYAELGRRADAAAAELARSGVRRIGILEPDAASVLALLAAASLVGVEACVFPIISTDEMAEGLVAKFEPDVLVTSREGLATPTRPTAEFFADDAPVRPDGPPAERPLLVLTTGTSGFPRGVRHDWSRLLRWAERIRPAADQRWLLAYGLSQFGGLQILIHVLASQSTLVAAESFQPRDGLASMRQFGVTHASGTPTFWRFLLKEMAADGKGAPDLRQVSLGGEAVTSALLEQIARAFPQANISQIYGATEFGQNVTVRDGLPGLPAKFLQPGGDVELRIVDGELWVRSRAAMLGYHGEDPLEAGSWRATGDLVELVGDRIEFRGRKTDVINVGGIKVHPLPVEERISNVPGVSVVRAFGRPSALTGAIVAVELVLEPGSDAESVEEQARDACADLPPAAQPRSFRFVDSLHTTGNKMTRNVMQ